MNKSIEDTKIHFSIEIIVEPDDGRFHAFCPALKGLHVGGETEDEAIKNALDGGMLYLESLLKHGDPIPIGVGVEHIPTGHRTNPEGIHAHRRSLALSFT